MALNECPDPCTEWFPPRFSEKYRKYYVNHEVVDRRDLKKLERNLVKAFRYAIAKLYRAKGYRLSREFLEEPERFGPTPGVVWILFKSGDEVLTAVGDSSIPRPRDPHASIFVDSYRSRLASMGYEVVYVELIDLSGRYGWADAERLVYAHLRGVAKAHSAE